MLFLAAAAVFFGAVLIPFCRSVPRHNTLLRRLLHYLFDLEESVTETLATRFETVCQREKLAFVFKFGRLDSSGFLNSICSLDVLGLCTC